MNIPPKLLEYFKGNPSKGHLKLMATIKSKNATEPEWAIFFGINGPKPSGDLDFKGTIDGSHSNKLKWKAECPLWLVPLTNYAKELALNAKEDDGLPRIICDEITIKNKAGKNKKWTDYKFWYTNSPGEDIGLNLADNTALRGLEKGKWLVLKADEDELAWPVWLTTEDFGRVDRLIIFPSPSCHIIDKDGQYIQYEVWFGVVQIPNQPLVRKPFVSVNPERRKFLDGDATPIYWTEPGRTDDVFKPANGVEIQCITWTKDSPIVPLQGNSDPLKEITNALEGRGDCPNDPNKSCLYAWLLQETLTTEPLRFSIIFARHYNPEGQLKEYIGKNDVNVIQICRKKEMHIFTRVSDFRKKSDDRFIKLWNTITGNVKNGLLFTSASAPIGIVPKLNAKADDVSYVSEWTISYDSCEQDLYNNYSLGNTFMLKSGALSTLNCTIDLPLLRDQHFSVTPANERIITLPKAELISSDEYFKADNDNGTLYQVFLKSYASVELSDKSTETIYLRDGAMVFSIGNPPSSISLPTNKYGRLRLILQLQRAQRPLFLWQWHENIQKKDNIIVSHAVQDFSIPVTQVDAAGQDILAKDRLLAPRSIGAVSEGAGERNESSLVIPLNKKISSRTDPPLYFLTMSESINVSQDHRFDIVLQEFNPIAGKEYDKNIRAVLLGSGPQFVAMVHARFLQQPGFDDGAWVLARRSPLSEEAGGWEILDDKADTEGFKLVLPSQAIGEAYVKNNLLKDEEGNETIEPSEPQYNEPASYRLGAPSLIRIAPERLDRRYVAAPWNLHRIWGQPGDAAPGVPFLEALTEFIYGLQTHIGPQQGVFIAELASKLGEIPVPPVNTVAWNPTEKQKEAFSKAWKKFLDFYYSWKSRLAILEPSADNDFGNATFDKNLNFYPRVLLEPRIEKHPDTNVIGFWGRFDKTKGADLKIPIKNEFDDEKFPTADPGEILINKIKAAHNPQGLAGGFHYGFESSAIYKEFWREAYRSSSGEVKAPAFSSLGAWAHQVAKFAGDKTIIRSVTGMGRTHFYAVERIGRIGVFWNKAKHVIEYERTVIPAPQFRNQPKHAGRVLVRKVREYVEVLEPVRKYPDYATDAPDAPGSVTSCIFKSKIIPVLSSWGHDVWITKENRKEPIGWEVPLWKPGAEPELYPKPQVQVSLLPPPDSDEKAIYVNLSEPQNLWFYTDTREFVEKPEVGKIFLTVDVHAWPAVKDVDYADLPEPVQYDISPAAGQSLELISAPLPSAIDIPAGFERYTFRVDRNDILASVVGRYYSKSEISGRLRTVSMSRMEFEKAEETKKWWGNGSVDSKLAKDALAELIKDNGSVLAQFANGFKEIENRIRLGGKLPEKITEFENKIKSLVGKGTEAEKKLKALKQKLGKGIAEPSLNYLADLTGKIKDFEYYSSQWLWREALEASEGMIHRILSYYDDQKNIFLAELDVLLRKGAEGSDEAVELLKRFKGKIIEYRVFIELKADSAVSAIQAIVEKAIQEIENSIKEKFEQIHIAINASVPTESIADIKKKVTDKIDPGFAAIREVVTDVFDKLKNTATGNVPWQTLIRNLKDQTLPLINEAEITLKEKVDMAEGEGEALIRDIKVKVHALTSEYETRLHKILQPLFEEANELVSEMKSGLKDLNKILEEVGDKIEKKVDEFIEAIVTNWGNGETIMREKITRSLELLKYNNEPGSSDDDSIQEILVKAFRTVLFNPITPLKSVYELLTELEKIFGNLEKILVSSLLNLFGNFSDTKFEDWLKTLDAYKRLAKAIDPPSDVDAILRESQALANSINKEFGRLAGEVTDTLKDFNRLANAGKDLVDTTKQTLNNFRSVWEEFTAPGMGFNRKTIAMLVKTDWKQVEERLSLTPCISRVKQLGDQLEGLGLRLPVVSITDRLLPSIKEAGEAALSKFDFSNLLSDLGGIRLDKLFPGFKMPEIARDKIKITQGFDKQNLISWVDAEVNINLSGKKTLMSIGPVKIDLENGVFTGKMRLEIGIDGKVRKTNSGQLIGTWHTSIAGTGLMIFREAGVVFKNDKLSFDMDPRRMEMPGLLKMLTDASTAITATGAGGDPSGEVEEQSVFKIGIIKVHGIPTGVIASLNIPPISVGGGTTAITNLSFGGFFLISALDKDLKFRFKLGLGFYLGKKEAPFNITFFILGGGGFIDGAIYFEPRRGLSVDFILSIHASAGLTVALGWMTGSITIMLGFEGEYHKRLEQRAGVYISIFVHVIGFVDILGFITIYLSLLLQATYRSLGNGGSEFLGRGQVRCTIRICRFIKISVNKSYTKVFSKSGGGSGASLVAGFSSMMSLANVFVPPTVEERAQAILISFE